MLYSSIVKIAPLAIDTFVLLNSTLPASSPAFALKLNSAPWASSSFTEVWQFTQIVPRAVISSIEARPRW